MWHISEPFGYELDLNLFKCQKKIEEVKAQVEFMKEHRDLIQVEGDSTVS